MQNIHTSSFLLMLQSLNFPMVTFCNYNALKNFSVQGNKNNNLTAFVQGQHNWSKTVYSFDLSFHNIAEQLGEKAKQKSLTQNLCDDKFRVFRITPQLNCIQSFVSLSTLFCLVMMSSWIRHLDSSLVALGCRGDHKSYFPPAGVNTFTRKFCYFHSWNKCRQSPSQFHIQADA